MTDPNAPALNPDDFRVIIDPCDNGFIVQCGPRREVVEEAEFGDDAEPQATLRLLYTVLDMLGRRGSKHDAARCVVSVVNQHGEPVEPE